MTDTRDNTNETQSQAVLTKNHAQLAVQVKAHIDADAVMAKHYWIEGDNAVGGTGCFIGCLAHSSSAYDVEAMFGLPVELVKIAEGIFTDLPDDERKAFFAAIPNAVGRDGKDLTRVHWAFLASELRALPAVPSHIQDVIDPVIAGMDLLASGGRWSATAAASAASAYSASYSTSYVASYAADSAAASAYAASYSTSYVASYAASAASYASAAASAYAADARRRQSQTLLRLMAEAE